MWRSFLFIFFSTLIFLSASAQENEPSLPKAEKDSIPPPAPKKLIGSTRYDSAMKAHNPRVAAIRSAILPGLGQIYNKKYWKVPIVYGALGVSGGIFFYNLKNYKDTRFAYRVKYNMAYNLTDSALYSSIRANLKPLGLEQLKYYRNSFRRDIDYSALFFLLIWGLNVVDATVDAHLKSFDVSPDLTLHIKPGYSNMAKTRGLNLVLQIGK